MKKKEGPKRLFRGFVGDEILHSYMGNFSYTIIRRIILGLGYVVEKCMVGFCKDRVVGPVPNGLYVGS